MKRLITGLAVGMLAVGLVAGPAAAGWMYSLEVQPTVCPTKDPFVSKAIPYSYTTHGTVGAAKAYLNDVTGGCLKGTVTYTIMKFPVDPI